MEHIYAENASVKSDFFMFFCKFFLFLIISRLKIPVCIQEHLANLFSFFAVAAELLFQVLSDNPLHLFGRNRTFLKMAGVTHKQPDGQGN